MVAFIPLPISSSMILPPLKSSCYCVFGVTFMLSAETAQCAMLRLSSTYTGRRQTNGRHRRRGLSGGHECGHHRPPRSFEHDNRKQPMLLTALGASILAVLAARFARLGPPMPVLTPIPVPLKIAAGKHKGTSTHHIRLHGEDCFPPLSSRISSLAGLMLRSRKFCSVFFSCDQRCA